MATNLTQRGRNANLPARLPALPAPPRGVDEETRRWMEGVREWLEVRLGARGDRWERAVTFRDLEPQIEALQARLDSLGAEPAVDSPDLADLRAQLRALRTQVAQINRTLVLNYDQSTSQIINVSNQVRDVAIEDVAVFAVDMRPTQTGGCSAITTVEFGANQPNFHALLFDPTTEESADFHCMLPFSWAGRYFRVYVYWGHGSGASAFGVAWEITANSTYDNESVILDFVPGTVVTDTGGTAGNLYIAQSEAVPIASYENEPGSLVSLRIKRRTGNAADTLNIDAALLAVRFTLADIPVIVPAPTTGLAYYEGLNPTPPLIESTDPIFGDPIMVPGPAGAPVTARNEFLARLAGSVTAQTFESRDPGSSLNGYDYTSNGNTFQIKTAANGNPDTGGIVLTGFSDNGRYNTSSGGFYFIDAGSTNGIRFNFPTPIAAFGCYVTDAGDFSGQWSIVLVPSTGPEVTRALTQSTLNNALIFIGFVDDSGQTYTAVKFTCTGATSVDGIGFDDVVAATAAQLA